MPLTRSTILVTYVTCASSLPFASSIVAFVGTLPTFENFVVTRPTSASVAGVVTSASHTSNVIRVTAIMVHRFATVMLSSSMFVKAVELC